MLSDLSHAAQGVHLTLGLLAIFATIQFILVPTLVAGFRQQIFELRRDLFCLAADGRIRPDDRAYVHLRLSMNGLLRFAERVTFSRMMLLTIAAPDLGEEHKVRVDKAIASIPDEATREELQDIRTRLGMLIVRHTMILSPIAWLVIGAMVVAAMVTTIIRFRVVPIKAYRKLISLQYRKQVAIERIQAEAEEFGEMTVV